MGFKTNDNQLLPFITSNVKFQHVHDISKKLMKAIWVILKILIYLDIIIHKKEGIHGQSRNNSDTDLWYK